MIVSYLRSSSIGNWSFCQHQYFLTYVLGLRSPSNQKADKGTITHKVMECLAQIKQEIQRNPEAKTVSINDDALGLIEGIDVETILKPYKLSTEEVDAINRTRINKSTYKTPCQLPYGHVRFGVEIVERLIDLSYKYYSEVNNHHDWKPVDFKDCTNWSWMALEHNNGQFDPRKRDIVAPEPHFDIAIEKDWAKFTHEGIERTLAIKGTIDLVTDLGDGVYEIVDWKTGQRLDWATGKEKDYKKLKEDTQLLLYHYACTKLFPEAKQIILTIFFIRDGGPFSMCFDISDLSKLENILKTKFQEISKCELPKLQDHSQKSFKCTKLCHFYKTKIGSENTCMAIHKEIKKHGMEHVIKTRSAENFDVNFYESPG